MFVCLLIFSLLLQKTFLKVPFIHLGMTKGEYSNKSKIQVLLSENTV